MSSPSAQLILIRHAAPVIEPGRAAKAWTLPPDAVGPVERLGAQIDAERLVEIVSSTETKAVATAEMLAKRFSMAWRIAEGLHEHERGVLPWMAEDQWRAQLAEFFARQDELIFGLETANRALQRFRAAVKSTLDTARAGDVVIVSHGTVMSLLLAEITGEDAFEIWDSLKMPDLRSVSREAVGTSR